MIFYMFKTLTVGIFSRIAEYYSVPEGRSGNLAISLVLCLYAFFIAY